MRYGRRTAKLAALLGVWLGGACGAAPPSDATGDATTRDADSPDGADSSDANTASDAMGGADASAETGADSPPPSPLDKLRHLVVVVLENRSFDNLYGSYPGAEGLDSPAARILQIDESGVPYRQLPQVDPQFPATLPNQPFDITAFSALSATTHDLLHNFYAEQTQIAGGQMNRFVVQNGSLGLSVGYYPTEQLPLARLIRTMPNQVTVLDHFFHAAFGGSFLNHIWLIAAATPYFPNAPPELFSEIGPNGETIAERNLTPDGFVINMLHPAEPPFGGSLPEHRLPPQSFETIGDRLNDAGIDWAWYAGGWNDALAGRPSGSYQFHHQPFVYFAKYAAGTQLRARHLKDESDLRAAIASGQLPAVSFFKPIGVLNQHPGYANVQQGDEYVVELIQSIRESPLWNDTAVIVTYDENGGFWDHVPPPRGDRFGPGTRIPAIVFSPFAKGGVDSTIYDTTAIAKLIESRWHLRPLSRRDAAQPNMGEHAFDFTRDAGVAPTPGARSPRSIPALREPRSGELVSEVAPVPGGMGRTRLANPFAYVPPHCYAKTRTADGRIANSCYPCHQAAGAPNFADDARLQLGYDFRPRARINAWQNVFDPPYRDAERATDAEILDYVRESNYFDDAGRIALRARLAPLPSAWDGEGDGRWNGFVPDAWFRFDERGFDVAPDGRRTGWRAFAFYPLPGVSFPSRGSMGDVLIRLDPALGEDTRGAHNPQIYEINLAIVEALITRRDVEIDDVDERAVGADLDLDGRLELASRVAFDPGADGAPRMRFVGRARGEDDLFHIAPGLFPEGTEFLHSVRYLDVAGGEVVMSARMKELRYAKKVRWLSPRALALHAEHEFLELGESLDGARRVRWEPDRGVYNGQGWFLQGFIEAANGSLRPESQEETAACTGCHGGIGATTDSMFALARKASDGAPARGWFHWTQHGLATLPEPRRRDGAFEYELYLQENASSLIAEDGEMARKFIAPNGQPRRAAADLLRANVAKALVPTAARALDLDRAYRAIVRKQSFARGRDVGFAPRALFQSEIPAAEKTGVAVPLAGSPLAP